MKHLVFAFLLLALRAVAAPLPANMTITANGDYDIATVPGGRYLVTFSNSFGGATVDVQRKASDGNYYDHSEHVTAGDADFRTAGYGARLHVTGATGGTFIVLTFTNIPGNTSDDLTTSLTGDVTGILPLANGGTGTATGSITGTTALSFTAGGTNQAINLEPSGSGAVVTTKTFTAQGFNASQTGYFGIAQRGVLNCSASAAWEFKDSGFVNFAAVQSLYQRWGSGTPEGVVTAPVGAIYHRTNGGANTSFYVKESGTGNTGWVAK